MAAGRRSVHARSGASQFALWAPPPSGDDAAAQGSADSSFIID